MKCSGNLPIPCESILSDVPVDTEVRQPCRGCLPPGRPCWLVL